MANKAMLPTMATPPDAKTKGMSFHRLAVLYTSTTARHMCVAMGVYTWIDGGPQAIRRMIFFFSRKISHQPI